MNRGLTLLEVIISIGICCTLLIGVLSLIPTARIAVRKSQVRVRADAEAQNQLERWRTQSWESIYDQDLGNLDLPDLPSFSRKLAVVAGPSGRLKELHVTVSWDWGSQPYSIERCLVVCNLPR